MREPNLIHLCPHPCGGGRIPGEDCPRCGMTWETYQRGADSLEAAVLGGRGRDAADLRDAAKGFGLAICGAALFVAGAVAGFVVGWLGFR